MTLDKFTIKAQEAVRSAGHRTCTYTQRSIGEGEGRHDLHLPETRCERPTDRDARG